MQGKGKYIIPVIVIICGIAEIVIFALIRKESVAVSIVIGLLLIAQGVRLLIETRKALKNNQK